MGRNEVVMASRATIRAAQGVTAQGARGMATLKQTEMRIKSTANISKITKAMQMVAAAKLKSAEKRLESSRPIKDMINEMSEKFGEVPSKKTTFVPLTTDRGLCGGVNINLCKKVANVMIQRTKPTVLSVPWLLLVIRDAASSTVLIRKHSRQLSVVCSAKFCPTSVKLQSSRSRLLTRRPTSILSCTTDMSRPCHRFPPV